MNDDSDTATENSRLASYKKLFRDVAVNVLANILAAPVIYLIGAATGIFRRIPAALVVSATILSATLTATSLIAILFALRTSRNSQKVQRVLFAASASALAPGVLFVALGLDAINRAPAGATISIVFGTGFSVIAIGLLTSGIKHRQSADSER